MAVGKLRTGSVLRNGLRFQKKYTRHGEHQKWSIWGFRSLSIKLIFCYCVCLILAFYGYGRALSFHPFHTTVSTKYILFMTDFWQRSNFDLGQGMSPFANCPIKQCYATSNSSLLSSPGDFDAVVFHGHNDAPKQALATIETWRLPHQRFVLVAVESPEFPDYISSYPDGFFNWTITYRADSDIVRPYGWFRALPLPENDDFVVYPTKHAQWMPYKEFEEYGEELKALARRPKKVAWVVSNCGSTSLREYVVQQLRKYIAVDVYGKCSARRCSAAFGEEGNCSVRESYKFYMGLENSLCNEYITEKVFSRMNDHVIITLNQVDADILPPHSHLNIFDYENIQSLAQHIKRLDENDTEYLSYFWWKSHYRVYPADLSRASRRQETLRSWCRLCEKLHTDREEKVYWKLGDWWRRTAECRKKTFALKRILGNI